MRFLNATGNANFSVFNKPGIFYIDKTLFVKDFIDNINTVNLITRPRRFGKSLNLDMLDKFLNISKDSKDLFKDKLISNYPEYLEHLNKYPIIRLSFNELYGDTYEQFITSLTIYMSVIYKKYRNQLNKELIDPLDLVIFEQIASGKATPELLVDSIQTLSLLLYNSYKQRVIILIDEYDNPFENAYVNNYYDNIKTLLGTMLLKALKSNEYLQCALLIGVKQVAQASLFSKLNNLKVYTIENERFASYFGFTDEEVRYALDKYGLSDHYDEVKRWYDGYNIGGITIYNPWSISWYLEEKKFNYYWVNTGSNYLIIKALEELPEEKYNHLRECIENDLPLAAIYTNSITYNQKLNYNGVISLLYDAGYFKKDGADFRVVNNEIKKAFIDIFTLIFTNDSNIPDYYRHGLLSFVTYRFEEFIEYFDQAILTMKATDNESYLYHIIEMMSPAIKDSYIVTREEYSPNGRSDLIIRDLVFNKAFIIEIKKSNRANLETIFDQAFQQIESKNYDASLKALNYQKIFKVVIVVHEGKTHLRVTSDDESNLETVKKEFINTHK